MLFTEFAITLAGSVLLSGVIALTLTPMMCAEILKPHVAGGKNQLEAWLGAQFERLRHNYQRRLHSTLTTKSVVAVFGLIVLVSCIFLYRGSPAEPAPEEDQGFMLMAASSDPYTTLDYVEKYTQQMTEITNAIPEKENFFLFNGGFGGGGGGSASGAFAGIALSRGASASVRPAGAGAGGVNPKSAASPVSTPSPSCRRHCPARRAVAHRRWNSWSAASVRSNSSTASPTRSWKSPRQQARFFFIDKDLKIDKPRIDVLVDHDKAACSASR